MPSTGTWILIGVYIVGFRLCKFTNVGPIRQTLYRVFWPVAALNWLRRWKRGQVKFLRVHLR
jgi:hypothetical protein